MYDYLVGRVLVVEVGSASDRTIISGTVQSVERENDGFATLNVSDAIGGHTYAFMLKPDEPVVRNPESEEVVVGRLQDFVVTAATPATNDGID